MLTAFEDTAHRYQRRVYSFARYLLSNREEAEDVTQEVLLRLWRYSQGVDEERLGSWLLRVTRNACYDLLRKRRSEAAAGIVRTFDDEAAREVASGEPGPRDQAEASDFRRRLLAALDGDRRALQERRHPARGPGAPAPGDRRGPRHPRSHRPRPPPPGAAPAAGTTE